MVKHLLGGLESLLRGPLALAVWITILVGVLMLHWDVGVLQNRVQTIEDDLNLGAAETTRSFRATVLAQLGQLKQQLDTNATQIQANGFLIRSLLQSTPSPTPDVVDVP